MDLTGEHVTQMAEQEIRQEHVESFTIAIKTVLDRIGTIKKSLRFQERTLAKLQAMTLEQFIEEGR